MRQGAFPLGVAPVRQPGEEAFFGVRHTLDPRGRWRPRYQRVGLMIKVAHQLAFPSIPRAGADGANVSGCQHDEHAQQFGRLHFAYKFANGRGIGNIAPLCRIAHQEVISYKPCYGCGVGIG